uniref:G-protein coupled receptors family 2 profile 2 domain-containing protein n=1 Tax=Tetranychus urticae TaxID=32264 RepID=T1KQR2_TETUR
MMIFFALATFVQHNDPDWYFWGSVYLVPTLMSTVQAFSVTITYHYVYQAFIRSCALLYSLLTLFHAYYFIRFASNVSTQGWIDSTFESQSMPSSSPTTNLLIVDSEEGREFLGSLIALLWIIISIYITTTNQVGDAALSRRFKILIFIFTLIPIILWFILYTLEVYLC